MKKLIDQVREKILKGKKITYKEALKLMEIQDKDQKSLEFLYRAADEIREKYNENKVDLCTIMNVKSGRCSEDCRYCAQSIHYKTGIKEYPLLEYDKILKRAREMEKEGAHRFSLVTSGRGIEGEDFQKVLDIYKGLSKDTNLELCASHGIITYEQAVKLKDVGIKMYHHNIETSYSYYKEICTTHTYEDRIHTIKNVQRAGLKVCCGGIIGMGEKIEDRIRMIFEIRNLGIESIPVNILNPIEGTPLEKRVKLSSHNILKTLAVYRLVIPRGIIRYAGGRIALGDDQRIGFRGGVNGALVGNYLTTIGNNISHDIKIINEEGLSI